MSAQEPNSSFNGESSPPDGASWQLIKSTLNQITVEPAALRARVVAEIEGLDSPTSALTNAQAPNHRTVASSHRLAATVASLTAMLVLSISLSGLLDEPSRHVRIAGAELMDSILKTSEDDWQVVVVKVPEASQARIRDSISNSGLKTGMDVHSVDCTHPAASPKQPDLLISSADSAATVLDLVDKATGGLGTAEVVDMDRERLLSCFVESMQSPSASEKYFGQMLILQRDSMKLDALKIPGGIGRTDSVPARMKPILVVLTSKEVANLGPQGAVKGRELPIAVLL